MDITLLEHFLVIADQQSFTKAADILDKSESVLSRQMARLENETGLILFDRSSRRISLTPAGRTFSVGAADVLRKYDQSVGDALDIQRGASGIIRMGMFENHLLPDSVVNLLQDFQRRYPKIRVQLDPLDFLDMKRSLMDSEIDLFYSATTSFKDDPELSLLPCGKVRDYLLISGTHPAASRDISELRLSDFRNDRFIIRENNPSFIRSFTQTCARAGFVPQFVPVSNQTQMLTMVLMNEGVLIIDGTHFFVKNSNIVQVPLSELTSLEFGFIYNREHENSCCRTLLDYLGHRLKN